MLILFVGVMFGVQIAQGGVAKVAGMIAANVAKKLPQQALTKGLIFPVVMKVAGYIGVSVTKKIFASGLAKAIPVVGAVFSGSLTLATFLPMSKRLQKHLASLELTKPGHRNEDTSVIDLEVVDDSPQDELVVARDESTQRNDVEGENV